MIRAFVLVFIIMHVGIVYNFRLLAIDTVSGNTSGRNLLVNPRYGFMRVPVGDMAKQFRAVRRISADFAQVYFPARVSSPMAYTLDTNDPWRRPSRYAPLLHTVCHYTLCLLPYGYASLLHILVQLVLFYLSFSYAFSVLQIRKYFLPSLLLTNIILFLTPVGLSWFERGQFSLYVTLAYLWLFLGIIKRNPYYLGFSSLLAFMKWTSFPLIFLALALWLIHSALTRSHIKELKTTVLLAAVMPLIIVFLLLFDVQNGLSFLHGLYDQELKHKPSGLSLAVLIPRGYVKLIPFVLVTLGALYIWWKNHRDFIFLVPYLCGASIILLLYPTQAYDYSTPCLLCFIPLLAYWAEQTHLIPSMSVSETEVSNVTSDFNIREALPYISWGLFCSFLIISSVYDRLAQRVGVPEWSLIILYMLGGISFIVVAALQVERAKSQLPVAK